MERNCGNCRYHDEREGYKTRLDKDKGMVGFTAPMYGGMTGSLNGKCLNKDSPRHGVVTGAQGGCDAFEKSTP